MQSGINEWKTANTQRAVGKERKGRGWSGKKRRKEGKQQQKAETVKKRRKERTVSIIEKERKEKKETWKKGLKRGGLALFHALLFWGGHGGARGGLRAFS